MIRLLRILVVLWLAVVLQSLLAPVIAIGGVRPDFPFLVVLLVAFREGAAGGALAGFVAGFFVDVNSAQALGASSLSTAVTAFGVGWVADRLERESLVARALVAFVALALRDQAVATLVGGGGIFRHLVRMAVPGALYTALLAAPVMAAAERAIGWEREVGRARR